MPTETKVPSRRQRVLDFDIENRPLTYLGNDFTTAEITAIAACWGDGEVVRWRLLGEVDGEAILDWFVNLYDQADIVTGHYIRRHDLPIINGSLLELGRAPLSPKLVSDTKIDLRYRTGVSASQESLAAMLGVPAPKVHMTQADWREGNRLTAKGLEATKKRVVGDVKQHMLMRKALIERGWLRPPSMWRP